MKESGCKTGIFKLQGEATIPFLHCPTLNEIEATI